MLILHFAIGFFCLVIIIYSGLAAGLINIITAVVLGVTCFLLCVAIYKMRTVSVQDRSREKIEE